MPDDRVILCLNSGSSSRKIALFRLGQSAEELLAEGAAEEIGSRAGRLWIRDGGKRTLCDYERADPRIHYLRCLTKLIACTCRGPTRRAIVSCTEEPIMLHRSGSLPL